MTQTQLQETLTEVMRGFQLQTGKLIEGENNTLTEGMQKRMQSENNKLTEQMRTESKLAAQFERANQQLSADLTKQIRGENAK
jgi:hypothetical protein